MNYSFLIAWYDRNKDYSIDYNNYHSIYIYGESVKECMDVIRTMKNNHDLSTQTPIEIVDVADNTTES